MVTPQQASEIIEAAFRRQVQNDKKVNNAFLLVRSEQLGVNLNIAEGQTEGKPSHPQQPNYMASVGKLFTSTIIGLLVEEGKLDFEDTIEKYLDEELMNGLHVYKGKDYSGEIRIHHLLNQSSGLYDVFWPFVDKLLKDPEMNMTPIEAIKWGKAYMKPRFRPGRKHYYSDTNYYLLGLIIEQVLQKQFHEVLHQYIYLPLGMKNAFMLGYSQPEKKSEHPMAGFFLNGVDFSQIPGYPGLDYTGGGVVAPLDELHIFMKSLVNFHLVKEPTLNRMLTDDFRRGIGIRYGYAIWKFVTIPLIMPSKFNCWGCVGATGAFMFYHPRTDSYIIGNFNDVSYMSKALQFMLMKIVKTMNKID